MNDAITTSKYATALAAWMDRAKVSQRDLAKQVGKTQPTVSCWVRGQYAPPHDVQLVIHKLSGGDVPPRCPTCSQVRVDGVGGCDA